LLTYVHEPPLLHDVVDTVSATALTPATVETEKATAAAPATAESQTTTFFMAGDTS
jgi:hypothetical protein